MYLEFLNDLFTSNSSIDFLMPIVRFFCRRRLTPILTVDSSRWRDPRDRSLSNYFLIKKRIELPSSHIDRPSMSKWFARDLLLLRLFFFSCFVSSFYPVVCSSRQAYTCRTLSLSHLPHATQHQPKGESFTFLSFRVSLLGVFRVFNGGKQGGLYTNWVNVVPKVSK